MALSAPVRIVRALLPLLLVGPAALAGDPPPPAAPPAPPSPAAGQEDSLQRGARFFDQSIAWVARGGSIGKAVDLYVHLDAKWDLDGNHDEGVQSVWYLAPDKMRTEMTFAGSTATKLLDGDRAWAIDAKGGLHRLHATPGAEKDLKQLKEDLVRVQDLTQFVTLEGLKGDGVVFEHQGNFEGSGVYAGSWVKVARRSPDGRKITFWLAYDKEADGSIRTTWPGIVRIEGDAAQKLMTEDWILKEWDSPRAQPRAFRYPSKIQGWRSNPDPAMAKTDPPRKFLTAVVDDIQVNGGIPASRFVPPQ